MSNLLEIAIKAAHAAGQLQKEQFGSQLTVNEMLQYDIKLEMDERCQQLITDILLEAFPDHAVLGEEGNAGNLESNVQWIVDPIDGTVNYFYGLPHFCVSIAAKVDGELAVGVIYDPILNETFAVERGKKPTLNGVEISTSNRTEIGQAVCTVGFSKSREALESSFDRFKRVAVDVKKLRMLGSAALALAYISCGRLDAYIEEQLSEWDIAAGALILQEAGGLFQASPSSIHPGKLFVCATNGKIDFSSYL